MRTNVIGTRENISVIDTGQCGGMRVEVLEYQKLLGSTNTDAVMDLYFMSKQNIKARQIAVYLENESVKMEPGAMSYFQGNIEMVSGVTAGNAIGRFLSGAVTGEKMAQPEYRGTGVVVLEPSFQHFIVLEMEQEHIVVDKGMFYCAQGSIEVKPILMKNVSSAVLGGEGLFQISLKGTGVVVLECPVPSCEIDVIELNQDTLKVDGNFAVLRSANIDFTVERSAKTLIGSAVSGEGLVNVYRGTGSVWLAPTIKVYDAVNRMHSLGTTKAGDMNTSDSRK